MPLASVFAALAAVSLPPAGWVPFEPWTDEFDAASLNRSKWTVAQPGWPGRKPGLFDSDNVKQADGKLQLSARTTRRNASWPAGFDNFSTSTVRSVARRAHAFVEVRSRSGSSAISSSFWFHYNDGSTWTEIDVFESMGSRVHGPSPVATMNSSRMISHIHIFRLRGVATEDLPSKCGCTLPSQPSSGSPRAYEPRDVVSCSLQTDSVRPFTFDDGFHTFALLWNESDVSFYADGQPVGRMPAQCLQQPVGLDFDRETMPEWMGLPRKADLPDQPFEIDWVRAWVPPPDVEEA